MFEGDGPHKMGVVGSKMLTITFLVATLLYIDESMI